MQCGSHIASHNLSVCEWYNSRSEEHSRTDLRGLLSALSYSGTNKPWYMPASPSSSFSSLCQTWAIWAAVALLPDQGKPCPESLWPGMSSRYSSTELAYEYKAPVVQSRWTVVRGWQVMLGLCHYSQRCPACPLPNVLGTFRPLRLECKSHYSQNALCYFQRDRLDLLL